MFERLFLRSAPAFPPSVSISQSFILHTRALVFVVAVKSRQVARSLCLFFELVSSGLPIDRSYFLCALVPPPRNDVIQRDRLLHGDQHHLMGNMFNLVIFGKMAEEDMGSVGASDP